ncbi:ATP-dependent DNA helicase II subunit 1 [Mycoblastus sanguinarius]|nr:ATP-dependent DNA helicase II subunit 1 [Mycoblastus sanguinarius]
MVEENKWKPPGEEEEEEEEIDETAYKSPKDAVLFIIEVSQSMLTAPPPVDEKKRERDTPTSAALKCAYALMQQRIISSPNDMMGVLLYGTEDTKFQEEEQARGGLAYPHCYLLTDLNIPAADDVKALKTLVEDEEESKKLLVPSKERVSMANVLFCANQIFTTKAPNFTSRRLFIVTDNDDPHANDRALKSSSAVRAKDLYDLGVIIDLFPISRPDHDFDRSKFYDDIIYNSSPTDPDAPAPISGTTAPSSTADGISLLQSLLSSINSKAVAKRALFSSIPLEIGPGFKISVKGYIIFKRQEPKRSCYVWLEGERPQIATGVSTQMADDTARAVDKDEIKKAYKFGGEQITFTPEEVSELRHFGDPGIRIIGFKPMSMLPIWANIKPSTFIYPSEDDYVGSTRVFSALQQKLLTDQKMAVAWFVARKNAVPVIAAILPGAEKLDGNGAQIIPPGMWLTPLPFADDIRQNPETQLIRAPEELIDRMREVVQQLQLPKAQYDPRKYPNPALQWHYRILQALALEEDIPEKPDDKTVPKYKQIDKRAGPYVIDWGNELHKEHAEWSKSNETASLSTKRSAPSGKDELAVRGVKKAKTGDSDGGIDDGQMKKAFEKQTIAKMTIPQLKSWMQPKGINVSGKKSDLVERAEAYFEQK